MLNVMEIAITLIEQNGYAYNAETDSELLSLCIDRANQAILNNCNIDELPEELIYVLATRSAGDFLQTKLVTGATFANANIADDSEIKKITEGDTTVEKFDGTSVMGKLKQRFADMKVYGSGEVSRFRCLKW